MAQIVETVAEPARPRETLADQLKKLPAFWMLNIMEMFERLAYYGPRGHPDLHRAGRRDPRLHLSQKGFIFMLWALVQTGCRSSGGFADRYGWARRRSRSRSPSMAGYLDGHPA
jgi:hypothetical protein